METKQTRWILSIMSGLLFMTACKKDISLPNENLEQLFGTWEWVQSSGGIGGVSINTTSEGYTKTIEFNSDGTYKWYKNGKLKDKMKFTVIEGPSIYSSSNGYLIKYNDTGLFDQNDHPISQNIKFYGQDILLLHEECNDCFGHIYVRK